MTRTLTIESRSAVRAIGYVASRALRWLADKCGGESDVDLRARMLGIYRGQHRTGTKQSLEAAIGQTITEWSPVTLQHEFAWHKRNGEDVLMVRFFRG